MKLFSYSGMSPHKDYFNYFLISSSSLISGTGVFVFNIDTALEIYLYLSPECFHGQYFIVSSLIICYSVHRPLCRVAPFVLMR